MQPAVLSQPPSALRVKLAETSEEVEQALRLRHQIFAMEAENQSLMNETGLEFDSYDAYSDHLIVVDDAVNQIVGTYRLLPGPRASQHEGFYSESIFNLAGFRDYMQQTLELGRSCIAPNYRNGRAVQLLWEGIANYVTEHSFQFLIGSASTRLPGLRDVNEVYSMLVRKQIVTYQYGIHPYENYKVLGLTLLDEALDEKEVFRKLPPLMKGYQWLGADIGGEPAYDPVFDTHDFFILLNKDRITRRYNKRFMTNSG